MADTLALFKTFLRVVEVGSFTAVAFERNTSQPTISRQIAALEDHLGCLLFQRTTRSLTLTDDGRQFYEQASLAIEAVDAAESAVGKREGSPSGLLKMSSAVVLGRLHIVPRLPRFLSLNRNVSVDFSMKDSFVDLVESGIDLAIRVGELTDPGLVARRIGITRRVVVATPAYLSKHGEPRTPAELGKHECILYAGLATRSIWNFSTASGPASVAVSGRFTVDNTEGVRAAILEGLGIGVVPIWHFVDEEIETGKLKVLLREFEPEPHPINAVFSSRRHLSPKIRAMIDFLAAEFRSDPNLTGDGHVDAI